MGKQAEGSLQERIQKLIKLKQGYCFKNHGDMSTEPGRPDIVACYEGIFIAVEVKVDDNKPSAAQGIHCRKIWNSGGIALITWDVDNVRDLLNHIDYWLIHNYNLADLQNECKNYMSTHHIDDGTRW